MKRKHLPRDMGGKSLEDCVSRKILPGRGMATQKPQGTSVPRTLETRQGDQSGWPRVREW